MKWNVLDNYQKFTPTTNVTPTEQTDPKIIMAMYLGSKLSGEAGEVSEHLAKWHRDGKIDIDAVKKELGDVCWYMSEICNLFDLTLKDVMMTNMNKLLDRKERGVLHGSGSDR